MLADIDNLRAELLRECRDRLHVVALHVKNLRWRERCGRVRLSCALEVLCELFSLVRLKGLRGDMAVLKTVRFVRGATDELLLEVFRSQDRDLCEEELSLNTRGIGIVQNRPYGYL